jgi:4-hydroxy-3-polyprenylbenzoate decarboxylase
VALPGILAVQGPPAAGKDEVEAFCSFFGPGDPLNAFPLVVVADDSEFAARTLDNFLWTTFTRSDPAADIHGIGASIAQKHWGCTGALVIDARSKPHHAPPLEEDPEVVRRVEALAAPGGALHGII